MLVTGVMGKVTSQMFVHQKESLLLRKKLKERKKESYLLSRKMSMQWLSLLRRNLMRV